MINRVTIGVRGAATARSRARLVGYLIPVLAAVPAAACSHTAPTNHPSAVVSRLGAVPIPTAPTAVPTATASEKKLALVAIGQPVQARLPDADAVVTALGPNELTPYTGGSKRPHSTVGIITITIKPSRGRLAITAADFSSRDESGTHVTLAPAGAASVAARAGSTATLRVKGTFTSGAAQITWRHDDRVIVVWDFNIELD